ncbi:MAG: WS/DGAT/MGAT family O-acyltransferase [Acidimicrobiales bacterium]
MKQLSALDTTFLYMETANSYGHVSSVSVYERPYPEYDAFGAYRRVIEQRLGVLEPLRRRLVKDPLDLDRPYWIIDPDFDLEFHLRHIAVPPPGDHQQLQTQIERLASRPLDQTRPLWETYVIDGLPDGRFAVFSKMHHATVDGAAGAELLGMITDLEPGASRPEFDVEPAPADPVPSSLELLRKGVVGMALQPAKLAAYQLQLLRDVGEVTRMHGIKSAADVMGRFVPGGAGQTIRRWAHEDHDDSPDVPVTPAPATSFNASIGPHRNFEARSVPLDDIKTLKNAMGATVNDVVMAICAGALRTWLDGKGELPDVPLVAMVPVSIRSGEETDRWTNRVSAIFAELPTNEGDVLTRVMRVHEAMLHGKEQFDMLPAEILSDLSQLAPPALAIRASRLASRMHLGNRLHLPFNLVLSNVPGPRQPLYLDEARLVHYYPVSTLVEGQGLNITVQSYLDTLDFGLVSCRNLVPDLADLADLLDHEVQQLFDALGLERTAAKPVAPKPKTAAKRKARAKKKAPATKKAPAPKNAAAKKKAAKKKAASKAKAKTSAAKPAKKKATAKARTPARSKSTPA